MGGRADLTVVDASFISLRSLLPAIERCTRADGTVVALIKPQFEVGREVASRGRGVVRDPVARSRAVEEVLDALASARFTVTDRRDSVLPGPKGNLEVFVLARCSGQDTPPPPIVPRAR
jgi:23S rRNA (cytidine1920-2'-O)/16S rRNA (cytidine1409-2'-O)-methyltransferase